MTDHKGEFLKDRSAFLSNPQVTNETYYLIQSALPRLPERECLNRKPEQTLYDPQKKIIFNIVRSRR